ncbi:Hexaprenyldihydroxybenzoate methyltransferase, mitochondrial-like protein [Gossypium australe]|uniref:Hexaprenyldihydroxybenzoate methyltransferase, mitochondrial-like protein n=1 Tax=Gossypium australe TaxID=47621 RepID=A0A5B6VGN4_9ROSI|nr:Hexaprenyldihydroxybenzoate methyltransferase, mitochondrial-like protein [Gossypium australe]
MVGKGDDPTVAEQWLSHVCRVLNELKCTPMDNFICWETLTSVTSEELIDWEFFLEKFQERYISVMGYEREFVQLSRFAKDMFQTEKALCNKFEWDLKDEICA